MSKKRITNLEERLTRLIEGGFARLFRGALQPRTVAVQLIHAIEDGALLDENGEEVAPTRYRVYLHPSDHADLLTTTPDIAHQLARQVVAYCQETGFHLTNTPNVTLQADPAIAGHDLRIEAQHAAHKHETTQIMDRVPAAATPRPKDAQLVINGKRIVPINRDVFNIGRHPENNLVLGDLRVSRHHIQLRLRNARYVLYDTKSRGGTLVNGQRVSEHILAPGDVIHIGGVSLLYLEEEAASSLTDTQHDLIPPDLSEGPTS